MKRRVFIVLLLLVAGAIVNVAVASSSSRFVVSAPSHGPMTAGAPLKCFQGANRWEQGGPEAVIWPQFAFNTAFYAGLLWLLFAAPFALRRSVREGRIKRGLCPKCAYDLRATEAGVCPECGATK